MTSPVSPSQFEFHPCPGWLPPKYQGAVCLSIDDVHPGTSADPYEAGGDLRAGAFRHVEWLLARHPRLRMTLFVTPDWRVISPIATRRILARLPVVRDLVFLAPTRSPGSMRVDRAPEFVRYLTQLARTEVGLHGLHHLTRGPAMTREFDGRSRSDCAALLREAMTIFAAAGLETVPGLQPPGWDLSPALAGAMADVGLSFVVSARDIRTPITTNARADMSGLRGAALTLPEWVRPRGGQWLIHFASNFQATSDLNRAFKIVEQGGLLAIKAHIIKDLAGYRMADGLDEAYRGYLDQLLHELENRYGDTLWWTSFGELAKHLGSQPSQCELLPGAGIAS
jgi:hypothetical protein